jgi:hypothetical protein
MARPKSAAKRVKVGKRSTPAKPRKVSKGAKRTKVAKVATAKKAASGDASDRMWTLIERVRKQSDGTLEQQIAVFEHELRALGDAELVAVEAAFCAAMQRAYDHGLWGAAYLIHGGCSDDAFWDFRAGLVALGRKVYESALRDPDSLAAIADIEDATLAEGFQYVPGKLLEERGLESAGAGHSVGDPTGTPWDEDALPARYPRLAARFD